MKSGAIVLTIIPQDNQQKTRPVLMAFLSTVSSLFFSKGF